MTNIEKQIVKILRFRAPNSVVDIIIYDTLRDTEQDKINEALDLLIEKEIITEKKIINRSFKLKSYEFDSVRETIQLGDREIPRLINGDQSRIEDINYAMESLAEYTNNLEKKFENKLVKQIQSYWLNIITLFAVFIALFSFVIKISNQELATDGSFWCIASKGFANLLPLIVLLIIMLVTIKLLFIDRKK